MTLAVFYTFAVADDIAPVVGAAVPEVLARQIPHLVVYKMNGGRDRGLRFFPLMGTANGVRQFFSIPHLLDAAQLQALHGAKTPVPFVIDGRLADAALQFRVHDHAGQVVLDQELPFDPLQPLAAARRIVFELSGLFGWRDAVLPFEELDALPMSYYLVARDDFLHLEAGIDRDIGERHGGWVAAASTALREAPDHVDVQTVALDVARTLARRGIAVDEIPDLLVPVATRSSSMAFVGEVAAVLDDVGYRSLAEPLFERVVGAPDNSEAVAVRLAGHLFRAARYQAGRDELERVAARGVRGARLLSQLAVFYRCLHQEAERAAIIDELASLPDLPVSAVRMVNCELLERGDLAVARQVAERCVARHPEDPAAWLEQGRALLHDPDPGAAGAALGRVLDLQPTPALREEALRLRLFVELPEVLPALRQIDAALTGEQLDLAAERAATLVETHPDLAAGWLFVAIVDQRRGRSSDAMTALRRAVALDPGLGEAQNRLGVQLLSDGHLREGHGHLARAIEALPEEWGPRVHFAQACALLGEWAAAREALVAAEQRGAEAAVLEAIQDRFFRDAPDED